jgi:glycosyltransferase involved in cell wall biosynthesis
VPDLQLDVAEQLGFLRGRTLAMARRFEDWLLRCAWRVSVPTEAFLDAMLSRGVTQQRLTFLPNGVDLERFRPLPPNQDLMRRFGLIGRRVFVYAGTQAHYHGVDVILEAAARLRGRDLTCVLAGEGPEHAHLKQRARDLGLDNVIFPGPWPHDELPQLYSIATAALMTIRNIPVARQMRLAKLLPALACGVPIIHSGEGEGADLITQYDCGQVVPPENAEQLALAMLRMAEDSEYRDRCADASRKLAELKFGWNAIVDRWLADLEALPREA